MNTVFKTAFLQEETEGFCRGGKTVRDTNARARKLAEKLAQRGVLAADAVNIRHAKLTEREYVTTLYHFYPLITR